MTSANPMEQETLEQVRPRDAESRAALENKLDQARPAADNANASSANAANDNQTLKNELPTRQYDAKAEASARLENSDQELRFGELKPNQTYERNGYMYETDRQGRVVRAYGQLESKEGIRTPHQTDVGHQGQEGDQGGHLIATRFNGSPEGVNLVPQDGNLNQSDWKKMENEWANALKDGKDVQVEINVHYPDKNAVRPDSFVVRTKIDGQRNQNKFFKNQPGG